MDKVLIKKHDKERLIITETLPYETPLFFSNYGLYKHLKNKNKKNQPKIVKDLLNTGNGETKPFNYEVSKPNGDKRTLSIAHPSKQISISSLIYNNSELITSLCSRSNFSIRTPTSVASYYMEKSIFWDTKSDSENLDMDVEQEKSHTVDEENKFGSSFFSYSGYTLIYKFYNSLHFQSLEKKYTHLLRFDISKCFNSIYTHSISWAIKSKDFAKENRSSKSFDGSFDSEIRSINEGETNGIITGPEFSRVFAELILQKIDTQVEKNLESLGLVYKRDYEVKRYVDDYFVFSRNSDTLETIHSEFKAELKKYKLFTNESKEELLKRPFISQLSIAKSESTKLLNDFFKTVKKNDQEKKLKQTSQTLDFLISALSKIGNSPTNKEAARAVDSFLHQAGNFKEDRIKTPSINHIYNPLSRSSNLINSYKSIVKKNNVNYEGFSGVIFSILRHRTTSILRELENVENKKSYSSTYGTYLLFVLDFSFFIYAMNPRVRTSFLLSQVLVIANQILEHLDLSTKLNIEKKIKNESRILLNKVIENHKPRIESMNLILTIRSLFGKKIVTDDAIVKYFDASSSLKHLNHFEIACLLYTCCLNENENQGLRNRIYREYKHRVDNEKSAKNNTELVLMTFDLISFPYRDEEVCKNALKTIHKNLYGDSPKDSDINRTYNFISTQRWFVDWRGNLNIKKVLQKSLERKEMQKGY